MSAVRAAVLCSNTKALQNRLYLQDELANTNTKKNMADISMVLDWPFSPANISI